MEHSKTREHVENQEHEKQVASKEGFTTRRERDAETGNRGDVMRKQSQDAYAETEK